MKTALALLLCMLFLMGAGCPTASQVALYLNIVAEGAASVIAASGGSGSTGVKVIAWAKEASELVIYIDTERHSTDSKAEQWTKISARIADVLAKDIPGVPSNVGLIIASVKTALLLLETALAHDLGQPPPATLTAHTKAAKLQLPHGRSEADAVATAKRTLAQ